jgi:hypothetical protein
MTWRVHIGISKISFLDHFSLIFRPEMLQFHPHSIFDMGNNGRICHILCPKHTEQKHNKMHHCEMNKIILFLKLILFS